MATKDELQNEVDILRNQVEILKSQLAFAQASQGRGINPIYFQLAQLLLEEPKSISELSEHFGRDPRLISQWLFQLKTRYDAEIMTFPDGKKGLIKDPFAQKVD